MKERALKHSPDSQNESRGGRRSVARRERRATIAQVENASQGRKSMNDSVMDNSIGALSGGHLDGTINISQEQTMTKAQPKMGIKDFKRRDFDLKC